LKVSWDQQAWGYTIADCVRELRAGDPVIEVLGTDIQPGDSGSRGESGADSKGTQIPDHIELVSMTIQPW